MAERGGSADAVAMETAVSRKDVSGKEKDVRLWPVFMITVPTKYNVWPSKEVDDKILNVQRNVTSYHTINWVDILQSVDLVM